jgi:hypothetical protein
VSTGGVGDVGEWFRDGGVPLGLFGFIAGVKGSSGIDMAVVERCRSPRRKYPRPARNPLYSLSLRAPRISRHFAHASRVSTLLVFAKLWQDPEFLRRWQSRMFGSRQADQMVF